MIKKLFFLLLICALISLYLHKFIIVKRCFLLDNITKVIEFEQLLDREGKRFRERNLEYMVYDIEAELLSDPLLFRIPIIRNGREVTLGYQPEIWKSWIDAET